ncbi:MAG TPA: hypothetical protein VI564_08025, partial [Candidatus Nanoarchaeia archaeon]|nr:hypothetical protein [Candidatus Nanoarchaeia archaeon]
MKKTIKLSNTLIAALLIIFNITVILNFYIINSRLAENSEPSHTGSVIGIASLCINTDSPTINLLSPAPGSILNGTINISSNLTNPQGITNFTMVFSYINNSASQEIGRDYYNTDYYFNVSLATGSLAEGNCIYKLRVDGQSNQTSCSNFGFRESDTITIDNIFTEPSWDNFRNSATSNFTLFSRWSNLSDIIVGNSFAIINFSGYGWNFDSVDIDSEIGIGDRSVNFTMTSLCFSSFSATISIFGVNTTNPQVLRNGNACPSDICSGITHLNNIVKFTINNFGNYSILITSSSSLDVWDEVDSKGGSLVKKAGQNLKFFANYSSPLPIEGPGVDCEIMFNISGSFTSPLNMSYNSSSSKYEYSRNFSSRGNYTYN